MKKPKPAKETKKKIKKVLPQKSSQSEDDKTFDFGGIPDRDLKKNLGCG